MYCDLKNCRLCVNGYCTDEEEWQKCPLTEVKLDRQLATGMLIKLDDELAKAYQVIGELTGQ